MIDSDPPNSKEFWQSDVEEFFDEADYQISDFEMSAALIEMPVIVLAKVIVEILRKMKGTIENFLFSHSRSWS